MKYAEETALSNKERMHMHEIGWHRGKFVPTVFNCGDFLYMEVTMATSMKTARGTYDILPKNIKKWHAFERIVQEVCSTYNYEEIRTPLFEQTELFVRGVGDTTDVVTKEMYSVVGLADKSGKVEPLTLRPEGTAGLARSVVEHKLYGENPMQKLYYIGPMFRYERPQAGRQRQFHQFGIEALGSISPAIDAEVIALGVHILERLGLTEYKVVMNSLGDDTSRKAYRDALIAHFQPSIEELCEDCRNRIEKNPLRVLDCKKDRNHELMRSVPQMIDYLSEESRSYFEAVKGYLDILGIDYEVDEKMVRGLDYYTETVFEVVSTNDTFGSQATLFGGGRYNKMIEELGGPAIPGIGFGMGIERIMIALELLEMDISKNDQLDAYIVNFDFNDESEVYIFSMMHKLRQAGLKVDRDYLGRSSKAQLKSINRYLPRYAIMVGNTEIEQKMITLKNVDSREQIICTVEEAIALMKGE